MFFLVTKIIILFNLTTNEENIQYFWNDMFKLSKIH